jgi:hypothetical protein
VARAKKELAEAQAHCAHIEELARPFTDAISAARNDVLRTEQEIMDLPLRRGFALGWTDIDHLSGVGQALGHWRRWADGHPVSLDNVVSAIQTLVHSSYLDPDERQAIVFPLTDWAIERGLDPTMPTPDVRRSIELDLGL